MMRRSVRYVARGIDADQLHPAFTFFRDGADRQVGVQVMLLLELLPENIGHRGRSARMFTAGHSDDAEDPPSSHTPDPDVRIAIREGHPTSEIETRSLEVRPDGAWWIGACRLTFLRGQCQGEHADQRPDM